MSATNIGKMKILIAGGTGQVVRPITEALAADHEVWVIARFSAPGVKDQLRARGVRTWRWDMGRDSLDGLPTDFTHVLHAAVQRSDNSDFDGAIEANTVGVGQIMTHCREARAFIYISTGALYAEQALDHLYAAWVPAYPVVKISAEGAVRAFAAALGVRTVIARLNAVYGSRGQGGIPVLLYREMLARKPVPIPHKGGQSLASLLHTDDLIRQVPLLWEVASSPALILNWGGDEAVGIQDCMAFIASITGVQARFVRSNVMRQTYAFDNTKRRALIGDCSVQWKEGVRRTLEAHYPGATSTLLRRSLAH
jgi:nucleoside-diphosphate-sugar epimerase